MAALLLQPHSAAATRSPGFLELHPRSVLQAPSTSAFKLVHRRLHAQRRTLRSKRRRTSSSTPACSTSPTGASPKVPNRLHPAAGQGLSSSSILQMPDSRCTAPPGHHDPRRGHRPQDQGGRRGSRCSGQSLLLAQTLPTSGSMYVMLEEFEKRHGHRSENISIDIQRHNRRTLPKGQHSWPALRHSVFRICFG